MKIRSGFTLVELLVVIVIIGILATQLIPTVLDAPARARDVARTNTVKNIITNMTAYSADYGRIPNVSFCIDGGDEDYFAGDDVEDISDKLLAVFSGKVPTAPTRDIAVGDCYGYYYKPIKATSSGRANTAYIVITATERFATANVSCSYALDNIESITGSENSSVPDCASADSDSEKCPKAEDSVTWCFLSTGS